MMFLSRVTRTWEKRVPNEEVEMTDSVGFEMTDGLGVYADEDCATQFTQAHAHVFQRERTC